MKCSRCLELTAAVWNFVSFDQYCSNNSTLQPWLPTLFCFIFMALTLRFHMERRSRGICFSVPANLWLQYFIYCNTVHVRTIWKHSFFYLPGRGDTMIMKVVFLGRGLSSCTLDVLIPVISPDVANWTASFVLVGDCVCAFPWGRKHSFWKQER